MLFVTDDKKVIHCVAYFEGHYSETYCGQRVWNKEVVQDVKVTCLNCCTDRCVEIHRCKVLEGKG